MPAKKKKKKKASRKNYKPIIYRVLALSCILIAIFIFIGGLPKFSSMQRKEPIQISSRLYSNNLLGEVPVRIAISKVNIDLPIVEARIIDGYWETSENTASYGLGSGFPNQVGNTVIFAHARYGLFYNLKDVKVGDEINVYTKDNKYKYIVRKITSVYPNQIEVIKPTKDQTLTLYTCTGFVDDKRLIVTATPEIVDLYKDFVPKF